MGSDFSSAIRPALVMTLLFALLVGLAYPLAILGVGQTLFPSQAQWQPRARWRQGRRLDRDRPGLHRRPLFPDPPVGRGQGL